MPTPEDIAKRIPVWVALSELFLDQELSEADCLRIARTLAGSAYSLSELDCILEFEVAAVCESNLRSPAGEWAGFDEAWLVERLTPLYGKRGGWFSRWVGSSLVRETWGQVRAHIVGLRRAGG